MSNSISTVRPGAHDDLDVLVRLNVGLFTEDSGQRDSFIAPRWPGRHDYFVDLVADGDRNTVWVAELDQEVVGYLVGRIQDGIDIRPVTTAVLESLYVDAEQRNAGVGASLVHAFLEWARTHQAGRASVNAYTENTDAIRFYERCGFRPKATTLDMPL